MSVYTEEFSVSTNGKGTYEITGEVTSAVAKSGIDRGLATVFVQHTSCSLVVMENADPSARTDLHAFFDHLVPEDTPYFVHTYEGGDDMPSNIRMCLTDAWGLAHGRDFFSLNIAVPRIPGALLSVFPGSEPLLLAQSCVYVHGLAFRLSRE